MLPTGYACALEESPRGALAMLLHSTTLLVQRRLIMEIELLKDRGRLIVLTPPAHWPCSRSTSAVRAS